MASLTLKNVPNGLLERLRKLAQQQRRSVTQQALFLIEGGLSKTEAAATEQAALTQLAVWRELAGRWESDRAAQEEIDDVYDARTTGREVGL
jgi:hypothetical protein